VDREFIGKLVASITHEVFMSWFPLTFDAATGLMCMLPQGFPAEARAQIVFHSLQPKTDN
jgi:hypothetical protein